MIQDPRNEKDKCTNNKRKAIKYSNRIQRKREVYKEHVVKNSTCKRIRIILGETNVENRDAVTGLSVCMY
jgi:hypothetical protein